MKMIQSAKGLLIMGGFNVSFGLGAGVYLGCLGAGRPQQTGPMQKYPLPERHRDPVQKKVPAQPLALNRLASAGVKNTQNQNRKSVEHERKHHNRPVIPKQQYKEIGLLAVSNG
jgi:hypothetical protein